MVTRALKTLLGARDEEALPALLDVYAHRADLSEAFPEAADGDYGRLLEWAAGVSARRWHDPAVALLEPHARWYETNSTGRLGAPLRLDWTSIREASLDSANPLPVTVGAMSDPPSDISHHLPTLSMLIVEFELRNVVELGVRSGVSTLALLEAATRAGGRVVSVDVEPCVEARRRVAAAGLDTGWRFIQMSDLDVPDSDLPRPIDLLFVDTTHLYEHTLAELDKYSPHLRPGSWVALHDYTSCDGVTRAAREFVAALTPSPRFYPFVHQNGLALIRLGGGAP
jgi:predicted O-methyltransferase YrrM